jgi:hypothetical protein
MFKYVDFFRNCLQMVRILENFVFVGVATAVAEI